jgi:hypothetical protein
MFVVADFVMVKGESSVEYGNLPMPGEPLIGPQGTTDGSWTQTLTVANNLRMTS